jgi:hypothetical protein
MSKFIPNNEHFLLARNIRNELFNGTDRYLLSDYPITLEQQMIIKMYRQDQPPGPIKIKLVLCQRRRTIGKKDKRTAEHRRPFSLTFEFKTMFLGTVVIVLQTEFLIHRLSLSSGCIWILPQLLGVDKLKTIWFAQG